MVSLKIDHSDLWLRSGRLPALAAFLLLIGLTSEPSALATGCSQPTAGLTGWWAGDGNANDLVSTNHGVLRGGATASGAGLVGLAFAFDGTNNYVEVPDSAILRPTNLTVEAWVFFASLDSAGSGASPPGQQYIVFKQNSRSTNFEGFSLGKARVGNKDVFAFTVSSASGEVAEVQSTTLVTTGAWYHVAGVRGPDFLRLYVNGQLESETSVAFAQDYGKFPLYFGTSGQAYSDHKLSGVLDEVSLYDRALSANDIYAIWAAAGAGKCKGAGIAVQPQSQTVLPGANVNFAVVASGLGPLDYQWRFNGANIAGGTGPNLALANVRLAMAGDYSVVVANSLGSVTSAVATLTVLIPDANLEAAIRSAINKPVGPINALDLSGLTSLSVFCRGVVDLSGLESITSLISLDLSCNAIVDLRPLEGLTNLVQLNLDGNRISNLSPLARLPRLTSLNIGDNLISDVSILSGLTNLTSLRLYHNPISALTPLTGLRGLTSLVLYNSGLVNIAPLAGLTNLSYLDLRFNPLTNAGTVLAGLRNLTALYLGGTSISNLSFLNNLTRLTFLNLDHNDVVNLSPLAALTALRGLDVSYGSQATIVQVSALTNLTSLYLSGNSVSNVRALTNLSRLTSLTLYHNSVGDVSPLGGLTRLENLGLSWNPVSNHASLAGLTNLTGLWLDRNSINDLSFVRGLTSLKSLSLSQDQLNDLAAASGLTNMVAIFADYNRLTNLAVLENLPRLAEVHVVGNLLDLNAGSPPMIVIQDLQSRGVNVSYLPQNQPPIISVSSRWIVAANATSSLGFDVSDDVTPGHQLFVTAGSSNPALIPNSSIAISGTNQNRTLSVTPVASQTGAAVITLTVTDEAGLRAEATLLITVVVPQSVAIPDANLEAAIRLALNKPAGALSSVDLGALTELFLKDTNIFNLSGLEWATNLTALYVTVHSISNLAVLRNLSHLKFLSLHCDTVDDYASLAGLTNLTSLDLTGIAISNLAFVQSLRQLTSLSLVNCRLTNVAPLAVLTNLGFLDLERNRLTDVGPLTNLVNLFFADVRLNVLETVANSALDVLKSRGVLVSDQPQRSPPTITVAPVWVVGTNVTSSLGFRIADEVTPPDELLGTASSSNTNLIPDSGILLVGTNQSGNTNYNRTLIVTPAPNQTGLALITLTVTNDAGLSINVVVLVVVVEPQLVIVPDSRLKAAICLALGKPSGDLTSVDMASLTKLHLEDTNIFNLSGLEWATNLTVLSVTANSVSNLSVLQNLTHLEFFSLHCNLVDDYTPLAALTNLITLELMDNSITNLSFLENLNQLTKLVLVNCRLTDISPLAALTNLYFLDLHQNRLTDISPLTNLVGASRMDVRLNLLENSASSVLDFLHDHSVFVLDQPQRRPPTFVTPGKAFMAANVASHARFSAFDDGPPNETLAVTIRSSDSNLVPGVNLSVAPDNPNASAQPNDWILTVAPPPFYTGANIIISLIASNEVSMTSTASVSLTIALPLPVNAQVLEGANLIWITDSAAPWFGQTNITHDGVSAAQSANIPDNAVSLLETIVPGPCVISFWWKVSSEPDYDWLEFYVDGELRYRISGDVDWNQITANIPAGIQTLKWRYSKDLGFSRGMDAAWLDQVVVKSNATVVLEDLAHVYDGTAKSAEATTEPAGLNVILSYNGSSSPPTNAASYEVIGTVNDSNYAGAATNFLTINKANVPVTLGALNQVYDGTARIVTAGTTPSGLTVLLSYAGGPNAPTNAGSYAVSGTVLHSNYAGTSASTLTVAQASLTVSANNQSRAYGQTNPPFTISYAGFVNGDDLTDLDNLPTAATLATSTSPPGDYTISLTGGADDNYVFNLANGTLTITNAPLWITSVKVTNGVATITWSATIGQQYRLQYKNDLTDVDWSDLSPDVVAIGPTATGTNVGNLSHRFYRVLELR